MSGDIERLPRRLRHLIYEVIAKLVAWTNLPRISPSPMAKFCCCLYLFKREQSDLVVLELASPEFEAPVGLELQLRMPEWL